MVQEVEELRPELGGQSFLQPEILCDREIEVAEPGVAENVAPQVSESSQSRRGHDRIAGHVAAQVVERSDGAWPHGLGCLQGPGMFGEQPVVPAKPKQGMGLGPPDLKSAGLPVKFQRSANSPVALRSLAESNVCHGMPLCSVTIELTCQPSSNCSGDFLLGSA